MDRFRKIIVALLLIACSFALHAQDWPMFGTDGHAKANGVNLTLKYPSDWGRHEGERPHIVQKFISKDERAYAIILVQDLGEPDVVSLSREDIESFFEPQELRTMVPDGMQFINAQRTQIEGLPAGILEYTANVQRAGLSADLRVWSLIFIERTSMVQLQFAVTGPAGSDTSGMMIKYKPIFLQIANSVILPDKWKYATQEQSARTSTSNPAVPAGSTRDSLYGENWGITLLLSFLVTWGIGLTPPLLIRFLFARRPIGKGAAIGIVSILFICNLVLFAALGSQSKSHVALVLIAIVSFTILRKGASQQAA